MTRKRWILLGEDDEQDARLAQIALQSFTPAHDIVVARDGDEVLDQLYRRGTYFEHGQGQPAVVLLDLKMPRKGGLEVLCQIKSDPALRCVPVVMLTSSRHELDLKRCYENGANGYIVKPMDWDRYSQAMTDFARYWLHLNELPQ